MQTQVNSRPRREDYAALPSGFDNPYADSDFEAAAEEWFEAELALVAAFDADMIARSQTPCARQLAEMQERFLSVPVLELVGADFFTSLREVVA